MTIRFLPQVCALRGRGAGRPSWLVTVFVACVVGVMAVGAAPAGAVGQTEALFRFGAGVGSAAGQLQATQGMAADPVTGQVYVGGFGGNDRIDVFTPWGEFVKGFGWDVAPGAVNEVQEVRIRAGAGSFKLGLGASSTGNLPLGANGEEVQGALDGLASVGGAGGSVSVTERIGSVDGTIPFIYIVTFKGSFAGMDVPQLVASQGATSLSGGVPVSELEVRTRVDGTPGGSGFESCTTESGCQAGLAGGGVGQFGSVFGIAVNANGDVYVRENDTHRVQEFGQDGHFILMFGGDVNKTKIEEVGSTEAQRNLCTAASGDVCQAGTRGSGKGQFGEEGLSVAVGAGGVVYVGDVERIEKFNPNGEYVGDLPDPAGVLKGYSVRRLAADPTSGLLYAVRSIGAEYQPNVYVLHGTSGIKLGERKVLNPAVLTVDPQGDLYVMANNDFNHRPEHVVEFSMSGTQIEPDQIEEEECEQIEEIGKAHSSCSLFAEPELGQAVSSTNALRSVGAGADGDLYAAMSTESSGEFIQVFGPLPLRFEAPPAAPPSVDDQFAVSVTDSEAVLRARIDPHFFAGSLGPTRFYVQYATAECIEEAGWSGACVADRPALPGDVLKAGVVDEEVLSTPVRLSGLVPDTAYRYRFVAEGAGAPGVSIVGVDGSAGKAGSDADFTTHARVSGASGGCANDAFRGGVAALLPDCRTYEMVSPLDKEGGEIRVLGEITTELPAVLNQSSVSGDKLSYGSYRAFGDAQSAAYTTQYIAVRGANGWQNKAISQPRTTNLFTATNMADTEFKFFSEDLCTAWLRTYAEPVLAPGAVAGFPNLYRRGDPGPECTGEGYEALTTVQPTIAKGSIPQLELQGVSGDGRSVIYTASGKLTEETQDLADDEKAVYEQSEAGLRDVCILPDGNASKESCSVSVSPLGLDDQRASIVEHAISLDGSKVFWTAKDGSIYLRENAFGAGEECVESSAPCTIQVAGSGSSYWGAAKDGSRAIFERGGSLYAFDLEGRETHLIASEVMGVAGMSEDATRVYLVSKQDLDESGPALAGAPSMYLYEAGEGGPRVRFVATLAASDVVHRVSGASAVSSEAANRTTRVSPDGSYLAFMSAASLTGYDNHDLVSGERDAEVYVFDANADDGDGKVVCVSCNPTGSRPVGEYGEGGGWGTPFWVGAQIQAPDSDLHESRVMADGGRRLFFETTDSLVLADTNGVRDVYEWEQTGTGSCVVGGRDYVAGADGCVSLISSGKSSVASEFVEASPDGSDVFFLTLSSLVPEDPGVMDVYDARVDGGFPPVSVSAECEGEACQAPAVPSVDVTPASASFSGEGNLLGEEVAGGKPAVKAKVKALTRAQKLALALRTCAREPKRKRARCRAHAHKQYGKAAAAVAKPRATGRGASR